MRFPFVIVTMATVATLGTGKVTVKAVVAFSPETPREPAHGSAIAVGGLRDVGDTVNKHEALRPEPMYERGVRLVEVVVNGRVAARREVPADGREHPVEFAIPLDRTSWVALRQFPQLHTNPVYVLVGGKPISGSRDSAQWALACIDQLWRGRSRRIAEGERADAEKAYEQARTYYRHERVVCRSLTSPDMSTSAQEHP